MKLRLILTTSVIKVSSCFRVWFVVRRIGMVDDCEASGTCSGFTSLRQLSTKSIIQGALTMTRVLIGYFTKFDDIFERMVEGLRKVGVDVK